LYYYLYNDYKINAKEIVVINEEFSFSKYKNNDKHKQWSSLRVLARPDQEYLEAMVKQAIYETYLHLKDLERKKRIFYTVLT
jgi:hypothetical protein